MFLNLPLQLPLQSVGVEAGGAGDVTGPVLALYLYRQSVTRLNPVPLSPAVHEVVRHDLDPVDVRLVLPHVDGGHSPGHCLPNLPNGLVYRARITRLNDHCIRLNTKTNIDGP